MISFKYWPKLSLVFISILSMISGVKKKTVAVIHTVKNARFFLCHVHELSFYKTDTSKDTRAFLTRRASILSKVQFEITMKMLFILIYSNFIYNFINILLPSCLVPNMLFIDTRYLFKTLFRQKSPSKNHLHFLFKHPLTDWYSRR